MISFPRYWAHERDQGTEPHPQGPHAPDKGVNPDPVPAPPQPGKPPMTEPQPAKVPPGGGTQRGA